MGPPKGFWDQKMNLFSGYCSHEAINSACSSNLCHENYQTDSNNSETKTEAGVGCSKSSEDNLSTIQQEYGENYSNGCEPQAESKEDCSETVNYAGNLGLEEEETTKLVFKFQYQTWNSSEEFKEGYSGSFDFVNTDSCKASATASTNKYEFISGMSFSHFMEEQEASNFTVKELYVHSKDSPLQSDSVNDSDFLSERNRKSENCERCVDAVEKLKTVSSLEQQPEEDQVDNLNDNRFDEEIAAADNFLSEDDFICSSSELDSISSIGDGVLSDVDFGTTIELDTLENHDEENAGLTEEDLENSDMEKLKAKAHYFQDRHSINSKPEESVKSCSHSSAGLDLDDSHKFDAQWEHQDLIEQLKMELNKVRATGLPTILENSESKIMEDLKPWKIDEKFQHGSTINELPKFYKSYRERMRKFDILNYQKLYALGSLESKDLLQTFSSLENSSPAISSFLQHIFHLNRHKNSGSDPMKRFIREFYSDLEMVYVGQLCLSWEFLQWEYERALELWESDHYRLQRYNEVAGEFQQFQVLLQRFIENEPFQGPRVENYVRNRCAMRNLLQVPVIREDNTKEEKKFRTSNADKDAITSDMLKGPRETQLDLQDPADSELVEIQAELQKKEKRLSEFLKSRSSILKKFQKHEGDGRDHFLYFFSQVDMKLVWRVLNMSRITRDQVAWCHSKLNKINL
ncbi:hypothetical protein SESBI_30131 [Sesbania bispinosa]|nr:hypothetical protein SESBI_30131 [Sesbania bispinosa]